MLFALLLGMSLNFLSQDGRRAPGVDFTARQLLRLGVALLGLRITSAQVIALGWQPIAMVAAAVALTIACGVVLARLLGFRMFFGLLTGAAVAMLLPVIALVARLARRETATRGNPADAGKRPPLMPWFAVAFAMLVAINSTGWLPVAFVSAGRSGSQWCLIAAMAAIGMKTHLNDILKVGWKPVALMVAETVFLAALFAGMLEFASP